MFSLSQLTQDTYPVAVIKNGSKVVETLYYTEPTREYRKQKVPFEEQAACYLSTAKPPIAGGWKLREGYSFEMVPTVGGPKNPRFINYYVSASNSGKSYQIASLCRRYLQQYPQNLIVYASANSLANDSNFQDLTEKIRELDVLSLESTIDFSDEQYHNSLWVWDDCDSGFSLSLEDLDSRLTEEELENLSVTDRVKSTKMLKAKCDAASMWCQKSIQSFAMNGRKFAESLCVVAHKPFDGAYENKILGEASGIVLFPASMKKNTLARFIMEKLSFEKQDAEDILKKLEWFQYDYLYISHRTSRPFILTSDFLKVYDM